MKIREAVHGAVIIASVLISAKPLSAQDTPMGDVARQARAEKSQAPHANKVVKDEDLGPRLEPVTEKDDPGLVMIKATRAWVTVTPRTCRSVATNNSGPGSSVETLREIAAPDRTHIVITQRGALAPGRTELIVIGNDTYSRSGTGPWRKDWAAGSPYGTQQSTPEALMGEYRDLKLVRRDTVGGSPAFLYETKFRPGGVEFRDRTVEFWIGVNDNLLLKIDTLTRETAPFSGGIESRETITCSYGSVPEIKPPI